jgi:hypothetical protein
MSSVMSPKIISIRTDFVNRMMTVDDYIDNDDQSIIHTVFIPIHNGMDDVKIYNS